MLRLRGGISGLRTDRRGVAAIEMVFVLGTFILCVLTVFQMCLYLFVRQAMMSAAQQSARQIQLGLVPGTVSTADDFRTKVMCSNLNGLLNCASVMVAVSQLPASSDYYGVPIYTAPTTVDATTPAPPILQRCQEQPDGGDGDLHDARGDAADVPHHHQLQRRERGSGLGWRCVQERGFHHHPRGADMLIAWLARRGLHRLRDRRGFVSLEFALVMPVMIPMLLCTYDCTQVLILRSQLAFSAQQVVQMASNIAATSSSNTVTVNQMATSDVITSISTAFYTFTNWRSPGPEFSVALSEIQFTPKVAGCTSNCTYNAKVGWSAAVSQTATSPMTWPSATQFPTNANQRPCGAVTGVDTSTAVTKATLPTVLFGSTPILVADITYKYVPLFLPSFSMTMSRSAFAPPRVGTDAQAIQLTPASDPHVCSGSMS